jgi:hypothetical protein
MRAAATQRTDIEIGRVTVGLRTSDAAYVRMLHDRFDPFITTGSSPDYEFDIELSSSIEGDPDADVQVERQRDGRWRLDRGDFHAEWDPRSRRGRIRQSANPYAIDSVLRIVHTLVLAREGGLLVHSASAVRNERAFLFSGKSGAGKTTMSRLAPAGAHVLSDEISYVRKESDGYYAYGTPFAGELARAGENLRAPLASVFLLAHGDSNRIDPIEPADAAREMLGNVLFFAKDPELVGAVFHATLALVETVPVQRLTFVPDARVWEMIQ